MDQSGQQAVELSGEQQNPRRKINPWIITFAVMLGTSIEVLDTSIANVALPHIAGSLSVTPDEATWVLTSYLISNGIVLPIAAWLSRRFGRKRYFIASIIIFTISSALCGLAPSLSFLIFFRVLQGLGGGGLQPSSQAILLETFPLEKRGQGMAAYGLGIVMAPMLGPVIGGWITDHYTWRWIFYVNVPIGIIAVLLISLFVFDPHYLERVKEPVDFMGLGFLAIGIAFLQYCLDKGEQKGWLSSHLITTFFIISAIGLFFFIVWELIVPKPITDLRIFKDRTFLAGCLLVTFLMQGLYANLVAVPLFLQLLIGYTATQAGLAVFPRGLGTFIGMPLTGFFLMKHFDSRYLIAIGGIGAGISIFVLSYLNLDITFWNIFWPQFLQGLSMSLVFTPLATVTYAFIPKEKLGNATSLWALIRNIGASIGISIAATLLQQQAQTHQAALVRHLTPGSPVLSSRLQNLSHYFLFQGFTHAQSQIMAKAGIFSQLLTQANLLSYLDNFRIFGLIFLPFIPIIFMMKKPPIQKGSMTVE